MNVAQSILTFMFQGFPESIALACLAYSLSKTRWEWKRIVLIGGLQACSAYVLKSLPISFGVHGIVLIVVLTIYLHFIGRIAQILALKASIASFLILIFVETFVFISLTSFSGIDFETAISNPLLLIGFALPQVLVLYSIALAVNRRNTKKQSIGA